MKRLLLGLLAVVLAPTFFDRPALAIHDDITPSRVTSISAYPTNGPQGDLIFTVEHPKPPCDGGWLVPTTPGFKATLSVLELAYMAQKRVYVTWSSAVLWPGDGLTPGTYCYVYTVKVVDY